VHRQIALEFDSVMHYR